jgi:hypothetical protein
VLARSSGTVTLSHLLLFLYLLSSAGSLFPVSPMSDESFHHDTSRSAAPPPSAAADAAHSNQLVSSLLVNRAVKVAKQKSRDVYQRRRDEYRRAREQEDGRSSSEDDGGNLSGEESMNGELRLEERRGVKARAAHRTTFVTPDSSAPKQNPLELMQRRAEAQEQLFSTSAVDKPTVLDASAEVWPSNLTHTPADGVDWEAEETGAEALTAAASSSMATAAAAFPSERPELLHQLSTEPTQPLMDEDDDGMDRNAWQADNEEVLFGADEEDIDMQPAGEEMEPAPSVTNEAAAPAPMPTVLQDPMLLNKITLKSGSEPTPVARPYSALDATSAAAASVTSREGPLDISFAAVSAEQISAELKAQKDLKARKYEERNVQALSKEAREEANRHRQLMREQRLDGAAAASFGCYASSECVGQQ